jgi:threonine synthase
MVDIVCSNCHQAYPIIDLPYKCMNCGGIYDFEPFKYSRQEDESLDIPGIWKYRDLFGLAESAPIISLGEGTTSLISMEIPGHKVVAKLEYLNPTGSFKDRGSAVLVSLLKSRGITNVVEDSSGNAGASLAGYATRAGVTVRIFVPDSASGPKIAQIEAFGAEIVKVSGPRSNAAAAVRDEADHGAIYASHAYLPQVILGYSTIAYEIWEQLGKSPGTVICPAGQGNLLYGIGRGFQALQLAGLSADLPYMVGVQARACCPLWHIFNRQSKSAIEILEEDTIAEGIRIKNPLRGETIINHLNEIDGIITVVDEAEIVLGQQKLARLGFHVEPTSAVVYQALQQILGYAPEPIVLVLTGAGLKSRF